ncbi:hypothetical protein SAMN05421823_110245 [Catalinimonas alkaloidigena]|uniref:Uncharacterized protein n=1 Tax=Catalinimonas alkaloidigena TaxID=1075417 RepID=A0A1G9QNY5_9BACT|nr:hypothetical protein [Catalinimonas alkaloidigena]SDM12719.1 hypothetical protein SAMN05421823_110245 [Catalinimonas alkaloidigena]
MKNIAFLLSAALCLGLMSCEQDYDNALDFSNTHPAYVDFPSGSTLNVAAGGTGTATVESPATPYREATVSWEITGAFTASGSLTIPAGASSAALSYAVPDTNNLTFNAAGQAQATLTLTSVSEGFVLGQGGHFENSTQAKNSFLSRPIVITKP